MVPVHESVSGGICVEITSSFWPGNWDLQLKLIYIMINIYFWSLMYFTEEVHVHGDADLSAAVVNPVVSVS